MAVLRLIPFIVVIGLLDAFGWLGATQRSRLLITAQRDRSHPFDADPLDFCLPVNHRVCLDEETRRCEPNYLRRPTITLTAGPTESSVYIAWVAQIILGEVLKFPTWLNGDGLGSHNFYEEGSWRLNQPRRFTFDAIMNADKSPDLSCSTDYTDTLPVPDDLAAEPVCQVRQLFLCLLVFVFVFVHRY